LVFYVEVPHRAGMKLYFRPLACSMATRISLYEAGVEADYQQIDHATFLAPDGSDVREIHPLGYVPVLRTDDGALITENAAILQYVAGSTSIALQQWLSFIGTELHRGSFGVLLDKSAPEGAKTYALANAEKRLPAIAKHLSGRAFLLDQLSVADAYLFTVLNWAQVLPIQLSRWPEIVAYMNRLRDREPFARAVALETQLYVKERK
jgi:glutathione S-transferase